MHGVERYKHYALIVKEEHDGRKEFMLLASCPVVTMSQCGI